MDRNGPPLDSAPRVAPDLADRLLAGDRRALARLMTLVESGHPEGLAALQRLYPQTGRAHVVGITGPPGSGKSTLVRELAKEARGRGRTVGVVAVDPSSPFTGGALLGDRIRMQELHADPGVFVRSMATRGALGGLARSTRGIVELLDAFGMDLVLVETVGVGQDEVEIARTADSTVVVGVPGLGDDVQTLKAGVLEIADVLVVNKADRDEAGRLATELRVMLSLGPAREWDVPVLLTVATTGRGVPALLDALDRHRRYLEDSGRWHERRAEAARRQVRAIVEERVRARLDALFASNGWAEQLERVAERSADPYTLAEQILGELVRP
jgi:LAO/AO transport system kinase